MTEKTEEKELEWVPCIWYLVIFKDQTEALLDSESEINVMNKLSLTSQVSRSKRLILEL